MKKLRLLPAFMTFVLALCLQGCARETRGNEFPAQWIFSERNAPLYAENWVGDRHFVGAMTGSPARIEAVRGSGDEHPFTYKDVNGKPVVGTLIEDDYILFTVPVRDLEGGSYMEIDATVLSNPSSPKYFIIEYLEEGKWKSVAEDLLEVPEIPQLKYSFMCSGIGFGKEYEYNCIYQTIPLKKGIRDGEVKIRFRAVGGFTCNGEPQNPEAEDGGLGFASYGFTGAYIQNLGAVAPKDTTDILCIGNSFTYFFNGPSMLKEIAWSQGHYFDISASLKGGQTLGQHTGRILTRKLIEEGGYDFAFLQDQSQAPARYAADSAKYAYVPKDYMALSSMIKAYSPECRIIMEHTWAYPVIDFGGFGDFHRFTELLGQGARMMADLNGAEVSPIGEAFEIVYNDNGKVRILDIDDKHQSHYGTYLKACINYLLITGEAFHSDVADCGLEPDKAAYLRDIAERTVLN